MRTSNLKSTEILPPVERRSSARDEAAAAIQALRKEIEAKLIYNVGKPPALALNHDWLTAAILAVRDKIIDRWMASIREAKRSGRKRVYYLSLEFLIGRLFEDALGNLGLKEQMREALALVGLDLDSIAQLEPDAALGNGGLGRLAACFMESMATLGVSGLGYGIRYDHGLFKQSVVDGAQVETPEDWLSFRNPWEFQRREIVHEIGFGGEVSSEAGWDGAERHAWQPAEKVLAVAYDTPVVGWRGDTVNTLRLWSAKAIEAIQLDAFNAGDHVGAILERSRAESISRILYPSDSNPAGQELRLRQEYFFASASLQDLIRRHIQRFGDVRNLHEKAAIQLNDTHPAIAVAELMRLLLDVHGVGWEEAWNITREATSYTNHTLLPEALETWPVELMGRLLPRHLQIIYAINMRFLGEAKAAGADDATLRSVSLIGEDGGKRVRMGNLAFVGSHMINGVSALHTDLMKETVFQDLNKVLPGRIVNKTNGITPRRWLINSNPALTDLLRETVGAGVVDDIERIRDFERYVEDSSAQDRFAAIKRANKETLAEYINEQSGVRIDPSAVFDVHVKRIHEYKRQLLNILETIALYDAIRAEPHRDWTPRVKLFAGKAAASYVQAKSIIRLVNDVARRVNNDPSVRNLLKVVFMPNFNVSLAEMIVPAADVSEQISTAGMEASGTGNMKLALNGALTIGTLDGANIEIRDHVGAENIAIFGMTADEVAARRARGLDAGDVIAASPRLDRVIAAIASGLFSPGEPERFAAIADALRHRDTYMVSADFDAYYEAQQGIDARWRAGTAWTRASILNVARMAWFSSDRTIRDYAEDIWNVPVAEPAHPPTRLQRHQS